MTDKRDEEIPEFPFRRPPFPVIDCATGIITLWKGTLPDGTRYERRILPAVYSTVTVSKRLKGMFTFKLPRKKS